MKRLGFYISIYRKIIVQDIKSKMSYRSDFIISMIGMILTDVSELAAFYIMFLNFPSVCGWTYHEMLFLYGFSLVALTPLQCLFDNNWHLRHYVYEGDFIKYCFRPINVFFYYISEDFDTKGLGQFFVGMGTICFAWYKLKLPLTFVNIAALIVALFAASLFMVAIMNIAAASCFFLTNSGYIMVTMNKFRDYAKYPVTIFPMFFRIIFTFIIPIAFIAYFPSLVILRPQVIPFLTWFSPVYGIIFFFISYKIWMWGASKYSGTGS
jgi:ABC-2 type transport system permease protein